MLKFHLPPLLAVLLLLCPLKTAHAWTVTDAVGRRSDASVNDLMVLDVVGWTLVR